MRLELRNETRGMAHCADRQDARHRVAGWYCTRQAYRASASTSQVSAAAPQTINLMSNRRQRLELAIVDSPLPSVTPTPAIPVRLTAHTGSSVLRTHPPGHVTPCLPPNRIISALLRMTGQSLPTLAFRREDKARRSWLHMQVTVIRVAPRNPGGEPRLVSRATVCRPRPTTDMMQ
jgi:hypothetical protein